MDWEKTFTNVMTSKGLITKIYQQLIQLCTKKKKKDPIKKMARRFQQTFFPEKTHRWQTGTCREAPHWLLKEKCKPKLQ